MGRFRPGAYFEDECPPADVQAKIAAYFEACDAGFAPTEPKRASTVMLLRERWGDDKTVWSIERDEALRRLRETAHDAAGRPDNGIEVFMIRRQRSMKHAPNAVVFPGGGVDRQDAEPRIAWEGPSPSEWAVRLDVDEDAARQVVVAAARELFEETGVLLAGRADGSVVDGKDDPAWERHRALLTAHEESFASFLEACGLVLRTDLLQAVSHWMTPPYEPDRYDTYFFVARMPEGQEPDDRSSETYLADWVQPGWALERGADGTIVLLVPTMYNLERIREAASLDEALRAPSKALDLIMPEPCRLPGGKYGVRVLMP